MAGYSGKPLVQKLGITESKTVGILNMPNYFEIALGDLPDGVRVHHGEYPADVFIVFAERSDEAELGFQNAVSNLPADGAIWIFWPGLAFLVSTTSFCAFQPATTEPPVWPSARGSSPSTQISA